MIVVLEVDDDDVAAVVESLALVPRRPRRLSILTEHTLVAHRLRRVLDWFHG